MPLVKDINFVKINIYKFNDELKFFRRDLLIDTLNKFWRWYAIKSHDSEYLFGPSKFCGYENMTADLYAKCRSVSERRKAEGNRNIPYPPALGRQRFTGRETHQRVLCLLEREGLPSQEIPYQQSPIGQHLVKLLNRHGYDLSKRSTINILE